MSAPRTSDKLNENRWTRGWPRETDVKLLVVAHSGSHILQPKPVVTHTICTEGSVFKAFKDRDKVNGLARRTKASFLSLCWLLSTSSQLLACQEHSAPRAATAWTPKSIYFPWEPLGAHGEHWGETHLSSGFPQWIISKQTIDSMTLTQRERMELG